MGDWKLVERKYRSPACNAAARAYEANIMLTHSLAMVPGYAFMNGENWGYAVVKGLRELGTEDIDDPRLPEIAQKHFDEKDMRKIDAKVTAHFYEATSNAVTIASVEGRPISHGALHSLLKSLIVHAWSAVETLTEDLWERVLNEHPHRLSLVRAPERDKKPLIDPAILQEYDFNVSGRMGTILKSRFRFHALSEIRLAYESSFSHPNNSSVLRAIADGYIAALYHLRNLIAHNTGVIDEHFLEETKGVAELRDIRALGEKTVIPFTGEMAQHFLSNGMRCACNLIESVDDWLKANP